MNKLLPTIDDTPIAKMKVRNLKKPTNLVTILTLADFFQKLKNNKTGVSTGLVEWTELSMGMSGDYLIAAELGATLVRVGSAIFGPRH